MYEFLNSNLLQTIVALFVGLFVFIVYSVSRIDDKRRAAIILMMEIRDIEEAVRKLRDNNYTSIYYTSPVMKENNWEKYKFMFTNDLDQDEYQLVSDFYSIASRIEEERATLIRLISFGFEIKCKTLHQVIVELAKDEYQISDVEFTSKINQIANKVYMDTPGFEASMPKEHINKLFNSYVHITTSTAGLKLKRIAKLS